MVAAYYDFYTEQGATLERLFEYQTDNETPINLSNATARMQVRSQVDSPIVSLTLTTENGRLIINGLIGHIQLIVSATDMAALLAGTYFYDLELVEGEFVTRLIEGKFLVKAEVTR